MGKFTLDSLLTSWFMRLFVLCLAVDPLLSDDVYLIEIGVLVLAGVILSTRRVSSLIRRHRAAFVRYFGHPVDFIADILLCIAGMVIYLVMEQKPYMWILFIAVALLSLYCSGWRCRFRHREDRGVERHAG